MVKTASTQVLRTGQKSPHFRLKGIDDKMHSLDDFNSKSVLVVFICNHCPYVIARIGDIINLQSTFKPSELQVIGVNSNDPDYEGEGFENMVRFARQYKINYPYLIFHGCSLLAQHASCPATFTCRQLIQTTP